MEHIAFLEVDSTDDPGNSGYIIDETKEYEFTVNTDGTLYGLQLQKVQR